MSREERLPKGRRDAGKAHRQWTSAAYPPCGRPVLCSRDWSILPARMSGRSVFYEEDPMSRHAGSFTGSVLAGAVCLAGSLSSSAMAQGVSPPDFAPNSSAGWFAYTREFIAPPSGPGPVRNDPAHPHVSNDEFRATGKQPTTTVADLDNPILQPWARAKIRERNEVALAGKQVFSPHATCWPMGVPAFLLEPMTRPMHF